MYIASMIASGFNVLKPLNMCPSAPHVALKQNVASVPANHAMQARKLTLPMYPCNMPGAKPWPGQPAWAA